MKYMHRKIFQSVLFFLYQIINACRPVGTIHDEISSITMKLKEKNSQTPPKSLWDENEGESKGNS